MLDIDPKNVDALNNKGLALDSLGNHRGAIAYFDKLYVLFGNQVNNMTTIGNEANFDANAQTIIPILIVFGVED